MKKLIAAAILVALSAPAISAPEDAFVVRYSTHEKSDLWGFGWIELGGEGNLGHAMSFDYHQKSHEHTHIYPGGRTVTDEDDKSVTLLVGPSYGVTDHFYFVPKIGVSRIDRDFVEVVYPDDGEPSTEVKQDYHKWKLAYGADFLYVHDKGFSAGLAIYEIGDRDLYGSLMLGYAF